MFNAAFDPNGNMQNWKMNTEYISKNNQAESRFDSR